MDQMYETTRDAQKTYSFRQYVEPGSKGFLKAKLTAHGFVSGVSVRFATGENGTLHLRPVIVWPGEISIDIFEYAENGLRFVSGDNESIEASVNFEIEKDTELRVYYENTGDIESFVSVNIEVTYFEIMEPANVIGPIPVPKGRWF